MFDFNDAKRVTDSESPLRYTIPRRPTAAAPVTATAPVTGDAPVTAAAPVAGDAPLKPSRGYEAYAGLLDRKAIIRPQARRSAPGKTLGAWASSRYRVEESGFDAEWDQLEYRFRRFLRWQNIAMRSVREANGARPDQFLESNGRPARNVPAPKPLQCWLGFITDAGALAEWLIRPRIMAMMRIGAENPGLTVSGLSMSSLSASGLSMSSQSVSSLSASGLSSPTPGAPTTASTGAHLQLLQWLLEIQTLAPFVQAVDTGDADNIATADGESAQRVLQSLKDFLFRFSELEQMVASMRESRAWAKKYMSSL